MLDGSVRFIKESISQHDLVGDLDQGGWRSSTPAALIKAWKKPEPGGVG